MEHLYINVNYARIKAYYVDYIKWVKVDEYD